MTDIKISQTTFEILKNFSLFVNQIIVDEPRSLRVFASGLFAYAEIEEELPNFSIYSLKEFINIISLFNKETVVFSFSDNYVLIADGRNISKYVFPEHFDVLPVYENYQKIKFKNLSEYDKYISKFELTAIDIDNLKKASMILGHSEINIKIKDNSGKLIIKDSKRPNSSSFAIDINCEGSDVDFVVKIEKLKFMNGNYTVKVLDNRLKFIHESGKLGYYLFRIN